MCRRCTALSGPLTFSSTQNNTWIRYIVHIYEQKFQLFCLSVCILAWQFNNIWFIVFIFNLHDLKLRAHTSHSGNCELFNSITSDRVSECDLLFASGKNMHTRARAEENDFHIAQSPHRHRAVCRVQNNVYMRQLRGCLSCKRRMFDLNNVGASIIRKSTQYAIALVAMLSASIILLIFG